MYSQGETFYYDYDGDEYELNVLENFVLESKEYIIAEDNDGEIYVFYYDEDEDEVVLVEDRAEKKAAITYWREECLLDEDISDFEDDEYYDREDEIADRDFDREFDEDDEDDYY